MSVGRPNFEIKRTVDLKLINNFLLSHPNFSVLDLKKMLTTNFFFVSHKFFGEIGKCMPVLPYSKCVITIEGLISSFLPSIPTPNSF